MVKRNKRISAGCGKHGRLEFATVPPCFSFRDAQLSGEIFLKTGANLKNVVTASQFFRAAIVTQPMDTLRHNNGARAFPRWARVSKEMHLYLLNKQLLILL